ncbi:nuclear transport factor 2 family protein [Flavobacterium sp.]|uniref:nuclear transport factor 2 family protein n=1 Tax=Flavobacterium sp. TaxID=239 RepID=UPI002B4AFA02|nr:nuclear transport factor 2 family protein [Flavobacterium sp.]HLP63023.1 nuclear transport factor 2 family protein [Flavobacterium sp.]
MKKIFLISFFLIHFCSWSQEKTTEQVVQEQLEAYNSRDIEAFLSFYSEDVKMYTFPNKLESEGKAAMRESYASFFKNAKVLNCTIKNRIVRKNIVIDDEWVKYNDTEFSSIAIYEVENNKIVKVTFIN